MSGFCAVPHNIWHTIYTLTVNPWYVHLTPKTFFQVVYDTAICTNGECHGESI